MGSIDILTCVSFSDGKGREEVGEGRLRLQDLRDLVTKSLETCVLGPPV